MTHLVATALMCCQTSPAPAAGDVEAAALRARREIRTAVVVLEVAGWDTSPKGRREWSSRRTFWQAGPQVRVDYVSNKGNTPGVRRTECSNCDRVGWGIVATELPYDASRVFRTGAKNAPSLAGCIDPRSLGYSPDVFALLPTHPDGMVGMADRGPVRVTPDRRGGDECWKLEWDSKVEVHFAVWVCPARGNNVVRMETSYQTPGDPPVQQTLVSDVAQTRDGTWFPRKVTYEQRRGAAQVAAETVTVTDALFNEPIPADTFTLAGIGLPTGSPVRSPGVPGVGIWDKENQTLTPLRPEPTQAAAPPPVPLTPPSGGINPWLAAAAGAAVTGVAGALVLFRRRRPHP